MSLLPLLEASHKRGGDPSITNITSISASVKWSQDHYAYNASKAAANSLSLMLAHELNYRSQLNIRVNALAPGLFETEMTQDMLANKKANGAQDDKGTGNPAGRIGTEEEMVGRAGTVIVKRQSCLLSTSFPGQCNPVPCHKLVPHRTGRCSAESSVYRQALTYLYALSHTLGHRSRRRLHHCVRVPMRAITDGIDANKSCASQCTWMSIIDPSPPFCTIAPCCTNGLTVKHLPLLSCEHWELNVQCAPSLPFSPRVCAPACLSHPIPTH